MAQKPIQHLSSHLKILLANVAYHVMIFLVQYVATFFVRQKEHRSLVESLDCNEVSGNRDAELRKSKTPSDVTWIYSKTVTTTQQQDESTTRIVNTTPYWHKGSGG